MFLKRINEFSFFFLIEACDMEPDTREIESISFGVYSEEEIIRMSACKLTTENSKAGYGSVYDPRMGTTDFNIPCETCKQKPDKCPGHFGYVEFNMPILHPLHIKEILSYLRCICMKCSRPLITEGQVDLDDLKRFKGNSRFSRILLKARKVSVCGHCSNNQPGFELGSVDGSISMVYLDKNKRVNEDGKSKTEKTKVSIALTVDEIRKILDNVSEDDVRLLGYDPTLIHPRNYIMTTLPILPPADRPYVIADGKTSDDDITIHYCNLGDTPMILWSGETKLVQDITIGDYLIGYDGYPKQVVATCSGRDEMFEIEQQFGDNYTVNSKHKLCLRFSGHRTVYWSEAENAWQMVWCENETYKRKICSVYVNDKVSKDEAYEKIMKIRDTKDSNDLLNIPVNEYLQLNPSTRNMLKGYKSEGVHWPERKVSLDPYILGMWLGNGWKNGTGFASNDDELTIEWIRWARSNDADILHNGPYDFRIRRTTLDGANPLGSIESSCLCCTGCEQKRISICMSEEERDSAGIVFPIERIPRQSSTTNKLTNPFEDLLREYGLVNNKHIPQDYLINSRETRLELLAGLIDTDGTKASESESIKFTQCVADNGAILEGFEFLVRSLGFSCTTFPYTVTHSGKECHYKTLSVSGDKMEEIPLRLARKRCKRTNRKDALTTGINVKPVGENTYYGLQLEGEDKKFLLGDFTVAHNCFAGHTQILTWDGKQKAASKIRIGDTLVGFDFNPVRVKATCTGRDKMYRVDQEMGGSYTVSSKHLLCLKDRSDVNEGERGETDKMRYSKKLLRDGHSGKYVNLSVERYLELDEDSRKELDGYRRVSYSSLSRRDKIYFTGIEITPVGEGEYYGFQIEGEDKRFLLADFTVVHNCDIIKLNNNLASTSAVAENKRQKDYQNLIFKVRTTFNNSGGKAKHSMNNRPIKCIKERLTGKTGRIRGNLSGKRALVKGTPVLCWSGETKTVEDIVVGDIVIGDDGGPRTVVDTLTGMSELFTIQQHNADDYSVSDEHILSLKFCSHRYISWQQEGQNAKRGGWNVKWFDKKDMKQKTKTFGVRRYDERDEIDEIMARDEAEAEALDFRETIDPDPYIDIHIKTFLALPSSVQQLLLGFRLGQSIRWERKEVELDPYILGMWLGDGTAGGREFTCDDELLIDKWREWAETVGGEVRQYDRLHYGIYGGPSREVNPLNERLRKYNLLDNKHIPEDYIVNDTKTRLALLAGLIDTDGSMELDGIRVCITQCEKHRHLIEGAKRIAHTLGFEAVVATKKILWTHKGEKKYGTAITLSISGDGIQDIPTVLERKKCKVPKSRDTMSTKITVHSAGIGEFYGFEVDQNNRFLLGDYTVTHNCDQSGRTVIGPDPTLRMDEMALPEEMAKILSIPVKVNKFNYVEMMDIINDGKANFVRPDGGEVRVNLAWALQKKPTRLQEGDVIVRGEQHIPVMNGREMLKENDRILRDGEFLQKVEYGGKRPYKLKLGDIVERQLRDYDPILLNRQPI